MHLVLISAVEIGKGRRFSPSSVHEARTSNCWRERNDRLRLVFGGDLRTVWGEIQSTRYRNQTCSRPTPPPCSPPLPSAAAPSRTGTQGASARGTLVDPPSGLCASDSPTPALQEGQWACSRASKGTSATWCATCRAPRRDSTRVTRAATRPQRAGTVRLFSPPGAPPFPPLDPPPRAFSARLPLP